MARPTAFRPFPRRSLGEGHDVGQKVQAGDPLREPLQAHPQRWRLEPQCQGEGQHRESCSSHHTAGGQAPPPITESVRSAHCHVRVVTLTLAPDLRLSSHRLRDSTGQKDMCPLAAHRSSDSSMAVGGWGNSWWESCQREGMAAECHSSGWVTGARVRLGVTGSAQLTVGLRGRPGNKWQ